MQAMREVRRARKQVSAVASAEHPSHDALAAALLQLRTATQHAQTLMHEAILAGSLDAGSAESGAP